MNNAFPIIPQIEGDRISTAEAPNVPGPLGVGSPPQAGRSISTMTCTILLVNLALGILSLFGWIRFGSIASGVAYLRGDRLIPDTYFKSFGSVVKGSSPVVEFKLNNLTRHPITVFGAKFSCACTVPADLPMVLPPGEVTPLRVQIHTSSKFGVFSEFIRLYTNIPGSCNYLLKVSGRVVAPTSSN